MTRELGRWLGLKDLVVDLICKTTSVVERSQRSLVETPLAALRATPDLEDAAWALDASWEVYATATFRTIRGASWAVGGLAGGGLSLLAEAGDDREPATATPMRSDAIWSGPWWRDMALGTLNGVFGDLLRDAENPLEIPMSFWRDGARLPLEPDALRAALPDATGRVCVFVHGMCTTEWSWSLGAEASQGDPQASYGSHLERDLGFTSLYLRYNSGLHVSENGEELSEQLTALLAAYPHPIEELVLLGHSMGGLVVRSACHQAATAKPPWLERVSRVICLAAPHDGAPLEKFGNLLASILGAFDVPGTQIPAELLNTRSAGLKDLRYGNLLHDDWRGRDPDALLEDTRCPPPPLDVPVHCLATSFTADPTHPAGRLLGDFMVRLRSASGGTAASEGDTRVLGGLDHYAVLNHPRVYQQIREWCSLTRASA